MEITEALAIKVRNAVIPGRPTCVGAAVRSFKIALNDSHWSSNAARAKGMLRISIAQLGSEGIDQNLFVKELALQTIKQIVPIALRAAASINKSETHKAAMNAAAASCALEGTSESAHAAYAAANDAYAYAYAVDDAAANVAAKTAAAYAYAVNAANAANANAYAAAFAANDAAHDEILSLMAEIGVQALVKAGSPGCEFLYLCAIPPNSNRRATCSINLFCRSC